MHVRVVSYRALAVQLPPADDLLDRFLTYLVERNQGKAFVATMVAALDAGRPVAVKHLVRGAR